MTRTRGRKRPFLLGGMGRHLFSANLKSPARSWMIDGKIPIGARGFTESTLAFRAVSTLNFRTDETITRPRVGRRMLERADRTGAASSVLQKLPVYLAAVVLRKCGDELDPARVLVEREARLDELLDLARKLFARRVLLAQDDEGFGLDEAVARVVADDRRFEHRVVSEQAVLDLRGRDEDAGDLEHVVRATVIPVVAFLVRVELVARRAPIARERRLRLLVRLPVAERRRVALNAQRPHLARRHGPAFGVHDLCLVAFDDATEAAGPHVAGPVRDVDVEHFRRADAVVNLDAERLDPAPVQLDGERLARRDRK